MSAVEKSGALAQDIIDSKSPGAVYSWAPSPGAPPVPYFTAVRRLQSERNEEADAVRSELHGVNASLSLKDKELQRLREEMCHIQEMNQTLQDSITALQLEAEENQRKCEELEGERRLQAAQLEAERLSHRREVSGLQERLQASGMKIQEMARLSRDYGALQAVFQSPLTKRKQNVLSAVGRGPPERTASSSTSMATYLQATAHLYKQLLQVQNRVLDDFDHYLENRLSASEADASRPAPENEVQRTFLSRLAEISEELSLLEQQREALEQRSSRPWEISSGTQDLEGIESGPLGAALTESQELSIEGFLSQPLYPHEALLNRYAVMIYSSTDDGEIYEELEGAAMCHSCGQKTILCPHKVGRSLEILLPRSCTHIKICRPQAHMSTVEAKIARSRERSLVPPTDGAPQITAESLEQLERRPPVVAPVGSFDSDVWRFEKDLEKQLQQRRVAPRVLSRELCVSLAQRLFLSIVLQLEGKSPSLPIQGTVRQFFSTRYVSRDISAYGFMDFWSALKRDSLDSKVLCILRSVLEGEMDPAILCYVLHRAEMVQMSPVPDMSHFLQCIQKLYPFLEAMEQDSLLLEFTGYSRRCAAPPAVIGFILHLILQHREPLIRECEDVLSTHVKTRAGHLTPTELSAALAELCPLLTSTQIESSIQRSVTASGRPLLSLRSAAYITAHQLGRKKRCGHMTAAHVYPEEDKRSGNKSSNSEDLADFQLLHNLLHLLKNSKP
ncbi:plectin-like isoform X2 [Eleutherodactylus coqui]|uniref:plectin-like isoform X2 n=1 Tax=Eleutherodactylus coqui TaxID=57060 RepID=UPI0034623797